MSKYTEAESYPEILDSTEDKHPRALCSNTVGPHKYNSQRNKPDTHEFILHIPFI